ncbi:DNA mismatch repair protein MutT [Gordoniibacillus kamchatkensis]|uniref:DNA mismatch repair protein MutT n=1 Tax=Gordoniibacillus kamchatkensis TaxID=1590651 RepID=A0ABR5AF56_9BACL|nr:NUDIX hydrolase [Paenibacillus sp. VKM B-2647]KIL39458.1 DNA mismatch repair protein MutT [Paenibacillus sp. VKM B-2647]
MEYYKELRKYVGHRPIILPGAVVIIVNADGEVLLQERKDGTWGLPGGLMDLGESFEETARREVAEETGLRLGELALVDVFSGSKYYLKLRNGDELYSATALYATTQYEGTLKADDSESNDVRFFPLDRLPEPLGRGCKEFLEAYRKKMPSSQLP